MSFEFTNNDCERLFNDIWFFGFPICILLTLTGTLRKGDINAVIIGKIIFTVLLSLIPIVIAVATVFDGLCSWETDKILFENKKDHSISIALRDFGCGAIDDGDPKYKIFKIENYTSYAIRVSDIDTTKIVKSEWIRIENK
jgi:hypothetical protein